MYLVLPIALAAGAGYLSLKGVPRSKLRKRLHQANNKRPATKRQRPGGLFKQNVYQQALREISLESTELSDEERDAGRFMKFSSVLLGSSATCALLYPPLLLAHIPPLLYVAFPMYRQGYMDLMRRRRITTAVVDTALSFSSFVYVPFHPSIIVISIVGTWFYALNNKLVVRTKNHTRKQLTNVLGEQPQTVWLLRNGVEVEVSFEAIVQGDIIVIGAGEMIPVDGIVTEGYAGVDQRMLTGESQPVDKEPGDEVFAATIVLTGKLFLRVEKTGPETTAAKIGSILLHTADFTSSVQLRGQEISDRFAAPTLALAALAAVVTGPVFGMAVLLSGMGYSMRMLGPLSVLNFLQLAVHRGILIKDGRALEQLSQVDTVVFDKTGTLTLEQPHLGAVHCCDGFTEEQLLGYAAAAEQRQNHPVAKAVLQAAHEHCLTLPSVDEATYEIGYGIRVRLDEQDVHVGSRRYMAQCGFAVPAGLDAVTENCHAKGMTLIYTAIDDQVAGALELHPTVRPEAEQVVASLRRRGLDIYIISGDSQRPTQALAEQLGIEHYFAETLPEHKADHIARLQAENRKVCFVGDGINDSIALKKAHVSVSLKGASSVATDTAEVILLDQSLQHLEQLFQLSEHFEQNMRTSLKTSLVPGAVTIAGAFMGRIGFGWAMFLSVGGILAGTANAMAPVFGTHEPQTPPSHDYKRNAET